MDPKKLQSLFDLSGRVAIVTGGTRGIGRAVAEGLLSAGANVAVASRKAEACASTAKELGGLGEVIGVATHMGDMDAIDNLVDQTVDAFGGVDIVVNNAATALTMPLGTLTADAWDKSLNVNL